MALGAAQSAQGTAPFNDSIRVADLKADLFFLAGDGFKGRLVGTPENALAAEFVRSRFERAGLKPGAPNGSFIQATNLMIATLGTKNLLELASADGTRLELKPSRTSTRSDSAPAARSARRWSTQDSVSTRRGSATTTTATARRAASPSSSSTSPASVTRTARLTASSRPKLPCQSRRCWRLRRRARSACSS